jgi:acyl-CoA dehydrogenase
VFARTGGKGRDGVTSFIVEKKFKGFSYKPVPVIRSYFPYEISLQDCEVPEENRLGNEGEGFKLAETWLIHARIPYAAAVIGVAKARCSSRSTGPRSARPSARGSPTSRRSSG